MTSSIAETSLQTRGPVDVDQLTVLVEARLRGRVRDLQLLALPNGLVLKGNSQTYYGKQLAQHAVMESTEFPILANEIEVS